MKLHKWSDIKRSSKDPVRAKRVQDRVQAELLEMSLGDLRRELGITQAAMADAADMSQGDVSKLEHRDDSRLARG